MAQFQEVIRQELENSMKQDLERLQATACKAEAEITRKDFEGFMKLFHRFLQEKGPSVDWGKIQRPPEDSHLNKTYNTDVPLVLMNSFNTDEDTDKILQKYTHCRVKIHTFNQSRYPRINKESLLPIAKDMSKMGDNADTWYPPGHGDIYASFYNSGLLDKLIAEGKEYIFVSNIDNLGATVDLYILNHLMSQPNGKRCEFVMEVTDKTRADVKVQDFLMRFESIPDMLELDHLTVSGDVTFGKNVCLKGTVIIIANHGDRIDIPAGAVLENKIVSGNLRILDH
ncbi:UTP--glucose-1-phosphate uridylyltransferase [Acipenser ruthenus]|uniref:UTP--glucose-1-phosphate uridylyltransferase n=1 Tax=Acipenser ruthenus TaxID=7906 RepID=A0A444U176_ACIRT|nr:UTP--glucose-1-phosphate uridylyltransferase [Acipenser ruthenus]